MKQINVQAFGASHDGETNVTKVIQQALDKASKEGMEVYFPAGKYLVGALFVKDNTVIYLDKDAILLGSRQIEDYPIISTRVAGIDMDWPAAVLNVNNCKNVHVHGEGTIDGQGQIWWDLFWGEDEKSGMMGEYIKQDLRWAVDYDCFRPRNICVFKSEKVKIEGISSIQSGFWNTHLCYSKDVEVKNVCVKNAKGPSTDGIDIDSCDQVLIDGCYVACNDDNIVVKAGRGQEAFAKKTVCRNITIQNCELGKGSGVTLGSETSGGIENVTIKNIVFKETGVGFRIKSANNRGGYIKNIKVSHLTMEDVTFPMMLLTNWYPQYSYCSIPEGYTGTVPDYWQKLLSGVSSKLGITQVSDLTISHITAKISANNKSKVFSRAFFIEGNSECCIKNIQFKDVNIEAVEYGKIAGVEQLVMDNVNVSAFAVTKDENDTYER